MPEATPRQLVLDVTESEELPIGFGFVGTEKMGLHFERRGLTVLAGWPGSGRTTLALHLSVHAASFGLSTMLATLGEDGSELARRAAHVTTTVPLDPSTWNVEERQAIEQAREDLGRLRAARVELDDRWRTMAAQAITDLQPRLLIVDGINRVDDAEWTLALVAAESRRRHVLVTTGIDEACGHRYDHHAELGDILLPWPLIERADVVLVLHRQEVFEPDTHDQGLAELIARKNRRGPLGHALLAFLPEKGRFADVRRA